MKYHCKVGWIFICILMTESRFADVLQDFSACESKRIYLPNFTNAPKKQSNADVAKLKRIE